MVQTPRSIVKPDKSILKSMEPFSTKTGYREDYSKNNNNGSDKLKRESRISFKPDATVYSIPKSSGFFDPITRSNESFGSSSINNKRQQILPIKDMMKSSYNLDFNKKSLPRIVEPLRHVIENSHRKKSDDKFESDSTYSIDYKNASKKNKFNYYW